MNFGFSLYKYPIRTIPGCGEMCTTVSDAQHLYLRAVSTNLSAALAWCAPTRASGNGTGARRRGVNCYERFSFKIFDTGVAHFPGILCYRACAAVSKHG